MPPILILGTAMWGWTISRQTCFHLLDDFYSLGFRRVDAATNYPINKQPADFRAAEKILLEWISAHGVHDLQVIMKVGSINNLFTPEHNLRKSFLLLNLDSYRNWFDSNLHTLMIHWDNRDDKAAIRQSLEALQTAAALGLQPGLSGIRHPEIYAGLNIEFQLDFCIQIKHNLFYSDYERYRAFHNQARFQAYGINAAGVKLDPTAYSRDGTLAARGGRLEPTPLHLHLQAQLPVWNAFALPAPITSFNQIGMIYAYHYPDIGGILIGPSRPDQLHDTIQFYQLMAHGHYRQVFARLNSSDMHF